MQTTSEGYGSAAHTFSDSNLIEISGGNLQLKSWPMKSSYDFNGTTSEIDCGDDASLNPNGSSLTVLVRCYRDVASGSDYLWRKCDQPVTTEQAYCWTGSSSGGWTYVQIGFTDDTGTLRTLQQNIIKQSRWYTIGFHWNESTKLFFLTVNGQLENEATHSGRSIGNYGTGYNFYIGASGNASSNAWDGHISEVVFLKYALDEDDASKFHNGNKGIFMPDWEHWANTDSYWAMGDGPNDDASNCYDLVGSNDGAVSNCTLTTDVAVSEDLYTSQQVWAYKTADYSETAIKQFEDFSLDIASGDERDIAVQFKADSNYQYFDGTSWTNASDEDDANSAQVISDRIKDLTATGNNFNVKIIFNPRGEQIQLSGFDVGSRRYTVTFNVQDQDGNHLTNINFDPQDSLNETSVENSSFTHFYDTGSYTAKISKSGFLPTTVSINETGDATKNITLNQVPTVNDFWTDDLALSVPAYLANK